GAAIAIDATGDLLVVGHTSGSVVASNGNVDVFSLTLSPTGVVHDRAQFGSSARDGADEWDEASIFIAGGGSTWVQALTYGNVDGAMNSGSGDVFLTRLGFDAVVDGAIAPGTGTGGGGNGSIPTAGVDTGPLAFTGASIAKLALIAMLLMGAGLILRSRRQRSSILT
ncbi:MAG: hypothetical protein ACOH1M_08740, partial [Rhodoglobus sp.]